MDAPRLPLKKVYELSQEYRNQAYAVSSRVGNESQLGQYYTLISMAIKALKYIKAVYPLSIEQDTRATFELVDLLLKETHNVDTAESYLSSLRERLLNHQESGPTRSLMNFRMHCELMLLYRVPMVRGSKFHYKVALRSCDQLLKHLEELKSTYETFEDWIQVFQYVSMSLKREVRKHTLVKTEYAEICQTSKDNVLWQAFVTLSHVNYLLNNRLPIPWQARQQLQKIQLGDVYPRWYAWKLLLELMIQIHEDKNITEKLKEFQSFFGDCKEALGDNREEYIVQVGKDLKLSLSSSSLLSYKDMKTLLLLLQSVSYLVNCHDKKANFSIKFLAKVLSTAKKSVEVVQASDGSSINEIELNISWYGKILSFAKYYQIWQSILLVAELPSIETRHALDKDRTNLLTVLSAHLSHKGDQLNICNQYEDSAKTRNCSNEMILITLMNSFLIRATLISQNIDRQGQTEQCNILWDRITKSFNDSDLRDNATLDCTLTMIWIMSHFEPFTSNPMPAAEVEKSHHIDKLRLYYSANKLSPSGEGEVTEAPENSKKSGENLSLKRSLMMQILLNYLGGRLFEQDLETICQISAACYRLAKIQKMDIISYIVGMWHLTNCTLAMKTKEVTIMSAKLEALGERLYDNEL